MSVNFWQNLDKPIIGLAPMDGITDFPMRQIQVSIRKPDVLYTEFISVEGFVRNNEAFRKTLTFQENERPIVVQLFGYTPELFYDSIIEICKLKPDGIDINMGCPSRKVLQKGGGGALIENYSLAEKIIEKAYEATKKFLIPLSIKTRIGKKEIVTEKWISFLTKFPLSEVTVHGRLLSQAHSGNVLWEEIQKAAELLHQRNIICLGNGGIKSLTEAKEKLKMFGTDGILIGQGALGNPWVFLDRKGSKEEILKTIIEHAKIVTDFYPLEKFVTILKHFGWYPKYFKYSKQLKIELLKTKNIEEVKKIVDKFNQF